MRGSRRLGAVVWMLALGCGPVAGVESGTTSEAGTSSGAAESTTGTGVPTTSGGPTNGGTTSDASSGTGTTGGTTFDPYACGPGALFYSIVGANVMLVVDKSGSMVADPDGLWDDDRDDQDEDGFKDSDPVEPATPRVSRWSTLHETLTQFATDHERTLDFGVMLFPSLAGKDEVGEGACPVSAAPELTPGPMQAAAVSAAVPAADDPSIAGARPAARAVEQATAALLAIGDERPNTLLFFSGGAANCAEAPLDLLEDYDAALPMAVEVADMQGIKTRVIGIGVADEVSPNVQDGEPDGVDPHAKFDELAELGGAAQPGEVKFFDAQTRYELEVALKTIEDELLDCTVPLNAHPVYWEYAEIRIEDEYYGQADKVSSCSEIDGWQFTSDAHDTVRLCGIVCDHFQRYGELEIRFECDANE